MANGKSIAMLDVKFVELPRSPTPFSPTFLHVSRRSRL